MKTIGLLGGMSWESTVGYYQQLNQGIQQHLGGLHSAKIALISVDFDEIERLQHQGDWQGAAQLLTDAARQVEAAGADFLMICTNTMHKVAGPIADAVAIPLLHIADATAEALVADNISRVGLLGTAFTMEEAFYKQRLTEEYSLEVVIPDEKERQLVHRVIYQELCQGEINPDSKAAYLAIIQGLYDAGAQAVILGCTEIGLLVQQQDTQVRLYDTTAIHAAKGVEWALEN